VAAGAVGLETIKSVAEHAAETPSKHAAIGFSSLRVATIAPTVSVAVGGESYSPATCGELWATRVFY
jgi:hypothetical protein